MKRTLARPRAGVLLPRVGVLVEMLLCGAQAALSVAVLGVVLAGVTTPSAMAAPTSRSAIVEIVTVPAIPGASFSFDGVTHKADKQGVVRLSIKKETRLHTVAVLDTNIHEIDRDLSFVRWWYPANHDQDFLKYVGGVRVHRNLRIKAAFRASYVVSYSFADQAGASVKRDRVTRVEFYGDNGHTVSGDGSGKLRMVGIRPVIIGGTVLAKQVRYSVQRVDVDGSNVVQVNQQVFVPSHETSLVVPLLLRTAHFSTRDFLFGGPVGSSLRLTYPNKRQDVVGLDPDGKATVENLARGQYSVQVNAPGYSFDRPVVLSRNQYIELPILSYLDLAVIGAIGLSSVAVLYVLRIRTRRARARADDGAS